MIGFPIGRRRIGEDESCFIIAEAGVNHNGRADLAHRLVDAAADAGADAIKFQTFEPALLASPAAPTAAYQRRTGESGQIDMLQSLVLPLESYTRLRDHARDRGLEFLSTPFDGPSVEFLAAMNVAAFKISSGDLTNHLLLRHVARHGRPVLLSTGMSDVSQIRRAVGAVRTVAAVPLALLHCVSSYPAPSNQVNLRVIPVLESAVQLPVGYSDHTLGSAVAVGAVALGARLLEKHITLDVALPGPDHHVSLPPADFQVLVRSVRELESALGSRVKAMVPAESEGALLGRRSLHWAKSLASGSVVAEQDMLALRPGDGVSPERWTEFVGRRLSRDVQAGERLAPGDVL